MPAAPSTRQTTERPEVDEHNIAWTGPDGNQNIAWTGPDGNFKLRGAAIVRDRDRILLCTTDGLDGWYLPGGKVEFGETAAAAVVRELREEMQLELTAGELLLVTEDMLTLDGTLHQEVCFYYAVAWPDGLSPELVQENAAHQHHFRWARLADLAGVNLLPPQLGQCLMEDTTGLRHLVFDRRSSDAR
jgi:ADP-ribose pyrophosphatase YjhB (NUDIX family)